MATRLSEQLDRIFANLKLAQSGGAPSELPNYGWQGDHLSIVASEAQAPVQERPPSAARQHAAAVAKKNA